MRGLGEEVRSPGDLVGALVGELVEGLVGGLVEGLLEGFGVAEDELEPMEALPVAQERSHGGTPQRLAEETPAGTEGPVSPIASAATSLDTSHPPQDSTESISQDIPQDISQEDPQDPEGTVWL